MGKNSYLKTHPLQAKYAARVGQPKKIFLHAEIDAIIKCEDIHLAHTIIVVRTLKNGTTGLAKPCRICAYAIKHDTPIKNIRHT